MITIENINRIEQKPLGKKNFYVVRAEMSNPILNPVTFQKEERYIFELSNRKYAITVVLDRDEWNTDTYRLRSSNGNTVYLTKKSIRNTDIFLDKLRLVALG